MGRGFIDDTTLTAIADAIREKAKTTVQMKPSEMAGMINNLGGGILDLNNFYSCTATPTGRYELSFPYPYDTLPGAMLIFARGYGELYKPIAGDRRYEVFVQLMTLGNYDNDGKYDHINEVFQRGDISVEYQNYRIGYSIPVITLDGGVLKFDRRESHSDYDWATDIEYCIMTWGTYITSR